MKRNELKQVLDQKQLNNFFSLEGGLPNELYCLGENGNIWEVYYSERGIKSNLRTFQTEDDACNYFYNWFIKSMKSMGLLK